MSNTSCTSQGYWSLKTTQNKKENNKYYQFNGLDWSLLVKHLEFEDKHNSWLYCFTNRLKLGLVKQYNQELCISSNKYYIVNPAEQI